MGRGIKNPCSRVLDKNLEEKGMLLPPEEMAAAKAPKVKETLDVEMWGTGKIESTPHGFFAKIMAGEKKKDSGSETKQALSKTWAPRIPFDHYNVAVGKQITDTA